MCMNESRRRRGESRILYITLYKFMESISISIFLLLVCNMKVNDFIFIFVKYLILIF